MHDEQFTNQTPWYKTGGGIAFLGLLGSFFTVVIIFFGLTAYYTVQLRRGAGADIAADIAASKPFSTTNPDTAVVATPSLGDNPSRYIRATNPQSGTPDSPVQIIAFLDFECPFCQAEYPILKAVQEQYESGISLIVKQFPLESIHPLARKAAEAAACATEQHTFWQYYTQLFETQTLSDTALLAHAQTVGLDTVQFQSCLSSHRYAAQIDQDIADGIALGVRGTPTFFIGSKKVEGVVPREVWDTEIISALQRATSH